MTDFTNPAHCGNGINSMFYPWGVASLAGNQFTVFQTTPVGTVRWCRHPDDPTKFLRSSGGSVTEWALLDIPLPVLREFHRHEEESGS